MAKQFISEFHEIRKQYFPDETEAKEDFQLDKIIKRLKILKNHILLEDFADLEEHLSKIKGYKINNDVEEIIKEIQDNQYASAIQKIDEFISSNRQLVTWTDPEIKGLKIEIKNLENQLNAYENEKIELEKKLAEFNHRHTIELGDTILKILKLRKQKFKSNEAKFKEAEQDEKQYREQVKLEHEREQFELTEEEKKDIKNKFRKASMLCHPDRVSDEFQETAQEMFVKLKKAYDANNLKKVSEIQEALQNGHPYKSKSETVSEKDLLKVEISKLKNKIERVKSEIITIKESDTYKKINAIDDWDEYFNKTKEQLQKELEELQLELTI